MTEHQTRFDVIIGGSGPAAIEAALLLRRLAADLVATTIVTPDDEVVHLPMAVLAPFARSGSQRYPLAELVADAGASCAAERSRRSTPLPGRSAPATARRSRMTRSCSPSGASRSSRIRARWPTAEPAPTSGCTG